MRNIKLIALDLDGTLFQPDKTIAKEEREAIRQAIEKGIHVVISSGRPYVGLPHQAMQELGIRYAITVNGAAVYRAPEKECIFSDVMPWEQVMPVLSFLQGKDVYSDVFVDGDGYGTTDLLPVLDRLPFPEVVKQYKRDTRIFVPDLAKHLREMNHPVQKITLDFCENERGERIFRSETEAFLDTLGCFRVVCGGEMDLEITSPTASKSAALSALAGDLGISMEEVMAIGDAQNDLDMIMAAGVGVAMENAEQSVKDAADVVTRSNVEHGVAEMIRRVLQ